MNCARCHTDWPRDRMFTRGEEKYCGLCWRVLIYPWKVGEIVATDHLKFPTRPPTVSSVTRGLQKDPTPHPWRYQKA